MLSDLNDFSLFASTSEKTISCVPTHFMQVLLKTLTLASLLWLMIHVYIYDSMHKCISIEIYTNGKCFLLKSLLIDHLPVLQRFFCNNVRIYFEKMFILFSHNIRNRLRQHLISGSVCWIRWGVVEEPERFFVRHRRNESPRCPTCCPVRRVCHFV